MKKHIILIGILFTNRGSNQLNILAHFDYVKEVVFFKNIPYNVQKFVSKK